MMDRLSQTMITTAEARGGAAALSQPRLNVQAAPPQGETRQTESEEGGGKVQSPPGPAWIRPSESVVPMV